MAAMRRTSDSGLIVALVVFCVLMFAGLGCAIWFYQQFSLAKSGIETNQDVFNELVHAQFRDSGWELSTKAPQPGELAIRYTRESYRQVAEKLAEAAEYEKVVRPMLGWESVEGMGTAMTESPIQKASEEEGVPAYAELRGLLNGYEGAYGELSDEVASLRGDNDDLSTRLEETKQNLVETQQRLRDDLSRETQKFKDDLAKLRADYTDLVARHDRQRSEATQWQQKHQQEVNERRREVAQLEAEVVRWRAMYEDVVAPPGERERLVADGEIIEVSTEYDFVIIEGGRDRSVNEDDRFVVYSLTPDGKGLKKGEILVGQVDQHTSLATVAEEKAYILEGDSFVSLQKWQHFQRKTGGGGGGEG